MATFAPLERIHLPHPLAHRDTKAHGVSEEALWHRLAVWLPIGFAVAAILGFVLITVLQSDTSLLARAGLAVYLGFWSGPFIGLSGAVFAHEWRRRQLEKA